MPAPEAEGSGTGGLAEKQNFPQGQAEDTPQDTFPHVGEDGPCLSFLSCPSPAPAWAERQQNPPFPPARGLFLLFHAPFVFFPHFYPSRGEKAQEVPRKLRDASFTLCVLSGNSSQQHRAAGGRRAVPRGPESRAQGCSCPEAAASGAGQPLQDAKPKKRRKLKIISPNILLPLLGSGHLPIPASHTPFSCRCRTSNTSPVLSHIAETLRTY